MKFSQLFLEVDESTSQFKYTDKIANNIFTSGDVTIIRRAISKRFFDEKISTQEANVYTNWFIREASKGGSDLKNKYILNDNLTGTAYKLIDDIVTFIKHKNKMPVDDIMKLRSVELNNYIQNLKINNLEIEKSDTAKKYRTEKYRIIKITSHSDMQNYGKRTNWDIAKTDSQYWNSNTNNSKYPVYMIVSLNNSDIKYYFIFEEDKFRDVFNKVINPFKIAKDDNTMKKWLISKFVVPDKFEVNNILFNKSGDSYYIEAKNYDDFIHLISNDKKMSIVNGDRELNLSQKHEWNIIYKLFNDLANNENKDRVIKIIGSNDKEKIQNNKDIAFALEHASNIFFEQNAKKHILDKFIEEAKYMLKSIGAESEIENGKIKISKSGYYSIYYGEKIAEDEISSSFKIDLPDDIIDPDIWYKYNSKESIDFYNKILNNEILQIKK